MNRDKKVLLVALFSVVAIVYFLVNRLRNEEVEIQPKHLVISNIEDIVPVNDSLIAPIIYDSVPDFSQLKIAERKKKFIDLILPSVLLVKYHISNDRNRINEIIAEEKAVSVKDTAFVNGLIRIYKVDSIEQLPKRMITPPSSIILAQAVLESGWGTSRFFRQGNNLFGMWSYSGSQDRLKAKYSRKGRQIHVRKFPDIYSSILNYYFTLGRLRAYREFREALLTESNPFILVDYLNRYSENGMSYVNTLKSVMRKNKLERYDRAQLMMMYPEEI